MKPLVCLLACLAGLGRAGEWTCVSGDQRVSLLEIFTSEGCSSCPPGERWMTEATREAGLWNRVVPVTWHVDYWDYLGWKDPYASPAYSERQRLLVREDGSRRVYTPGFFLNGRADRHYFERKPLPSDNASAGILRVTLDGAVLTASFDTEEKGPLVLNLAWMDSGILQPVAAGENRGRKLPHEHVVREHQTVTSETASWRIEVTPAMRAHDELAVWVCREDSLAPLQATGGVLPEVSGD